MYTIDVPRKLPYGAGAVPPAPPWPGWFRRPPRPSPSGQFDSIGPDDPGFRQVHVYGCVRFALDIWEHYLGQPIRWHFADHFPRLEIVTLGPWANAHMGYGFLEVGQRVMAHGRVADLALDFDVIGHETGHALMMAFAGRLSMAGVTPDYEALHEASADWAAMIAALHFETVLVELLETTRGDLYTANRLNRFAEFSRTKQIRRANNNRTMWEFARGWTNEHETAEPLIGGIFDAFVEIYKELLVRRGAIPRALDEMAQRARADRRLEAPVRAAFAAAYGHHPHAFLDALTEARHIAGTILVALWRSVSPTGFRLADIVPILRELVLDAYDGTLAPIVAGALERRGIGVVPLGPRLAPPGADSHLHSERTSAPRSATIRAF
jgi:hypothetical protein